MHLKRNYSHYAAVFLILLCIYILVFSGISSTDDEQLFVVITENLAYDKDYSALPLFGNDRLQGEASGVEPLHSIVGIPLVKIADYFSLGKSQILYPHRSPAGKHRRTKRRDTENRHCVGFIIWYRDDLISLRAHEFPRTTSCSAYHHCSAMP